MIFQTSFFSRSTFAFTIARIFSQILCIQPHAQTCCRYTSGTKEQARPASTFSISEFKSLNIPFCPQFDIVISLISKKQTHYFYEPHTIFLGLAKIHSVVTVHTLSFTPKQMSQEIKNFSKYFTLSYKCIVKVQKKIVKSQLRLHFFWHQSLLGTSRLQILK